MKAKLLLLTILVVFLNTAMAQEKLLKTIGGVAKQKVEQQDFNTTRNNKEKGNLQEDKKSAPAPSVPADTMKPNSALSKFSNAKYNSSYTFTDRVTYEMEDYKNGKKTYVSHHFSDSAVLSVQDSLKNSSIFDFANESMITFNEKDMSAMAMSAHWLSKTTENQQGKKEDVKVTKTGRTRKLLGCTCDEYEAVRCRVKAVN
jgi:hypothetical protein